MSMTNIHRSINSLHDLLFPFHLESLFFPIFDKFLGSNNFLDKFSRVKLIFGTTIFGGQTYFGRQNVGVPLLWGHYKFLGSTIFGTNILGVKHFLGQYIFGGQHFSDIDIDYQCNAFVHLLWINLIWFLSVRIS